MREKTEIITEEIPEFQVKHVSNYQGKLMKGNHLRKNLILRSRKNFAPRKNITEQKLD